jgi:hypothetical protein
MKQNEHVYNVVSTSKKMLHVVENIFHHADAPHGHDMFHADNVPTSIHLIQGQ